MECLKYANKQNNFEIHIGTNGAVGIPRLLETTKRQKDNIIFEGTKEECYKFYNASKDTHLNIPFHVVKINGEYEIYHTTGDYLKKYNIEIILTADTYDECKEWLTNFKSAYKDEPHMYAAYDKYIWTHMNAEKEKIFFAGVSWAYQCLLGKKCDRRKVICIVIVTTSLLKFPRTKN